MPFLCNGSIGLPVCTSGNAVKGSLGVCELFLSGQVSHLNEIRLSLQKAMLFDKVEPYGSKN